MSKFFGEKLKQIRQEKNLSQEDFANLLGTSKQVISRYETGQRTPKITIAQQYADKLNVPLSFLIDDQLQDAAAEASILNNPKINAIARGLEGLGDDDLDFVLEFTRKAFKKI